jgi:hypothetical protein
MTTNRVDRTAAILQCVQPSGCLRQRTAWACSGAQPNPTQHAGRCPPYACKSSSTSVQKVLRNFARALLLCKPAPAPSRKEEKKPTTCVTPCRRELLPPRAANLSSVVIYSLRFLFVDAHRFTFELLDVNK